MAAPFIAVRLVTLSPKSWVELRFYGQPYQPIVCRRRLGSDVGERPRPAKPEEVRAANQILLQTAPREAL